MERSGIFDADYCCLFITKRLLHINAYAYSLPLAYAIAL